MTDEQLQGISQQQSHAIQAYLETEGSIRQLQAQIARLKARQDVLFQDILDASAALKEASAAMEHRVEDQPKETVE